MALAGRSARRGAGARWLVIGVVVTMLVLLIDASLHSRSPGPGQELAAGAWIDRVLPVVAESNNEGTQLAQLWTDALSMKSAQVTSSIDQLAAGAAEAYKRAVALRPPTSLAGPAGLLEACLLARSQGASALQTVFHQALGGAGATDDSPGVQTARDDLQVGDQAYKLFLSSMSRGGLTIPASVWLANPGPYEPQASQAFLASLHNSASATPLHQLAIYAVSTTPAPVSSDGTTELLPTARAITVTIVVADTGNQPEKNLTVTATISPSTGASSARDFVDLAPGQAHTIVNLGPLNPPAGVPVSLTVSVTPPAGSSTAAATKVIAFSMPVPPPPTTTSTTSPAKATSTTKPGG